MLVICKKSPISGKENTMTLDVTPKEMYDWQSGMLIQDACPRLNVDEREFLMTGITPDEWDNIYGEEE